MKILITENQLKDLQYNKESVKVYNKIVKSIKSRKIEYELTNPDIDTVKDTKGTYHQLHGVKFNLNQLFENFDIDILLVNRIGKTDAAGFYDSMNNRMCFFILGDKGDKMSFENYTRLANIRFETWVDDDFFIHEFIHYLDSKRYSNTYSIKQPNSLEDYYNSPEEYNAYTHEIIKKILKTENKLKSLSFNEFLKRSMKYGSSEFLDNLNDENRKKLIKRLYSIYVS